MTEQEALAVLAVVRRHLGRAYKSAIRNAWASGAYDAEGLEEWESALQRIRNHFGPAWLVKAQPGRHTEPA